MFNNVEYFLFERQTIKSFLPEMLQKNKGHIVNIASLAGLNGINRLVDYCSSKFAVVGLSESLDMELKVIGINTCFSFQSKIYNTTFAGVYGNSSNSLITISKFIS